MKLTFSTLFFAAATAAITAVASPAFADARYDVGMSSTTATASTVSRAEVRAELARARAAGELAFSHNEYPVLQPSMHDMSNVSRADVKAELARARAANEIPHFVNG